MAISARLTPFILNWWMEETYIFYDVFDLKLGNSVHMRDETWKHVSEHRQSLSVVWIHDLWIRRICTFRHRSGSQLAVHSDMANFRIQVCRCLWCKETGEQNDMSRSWPLLGLPSRCPLCQGTATFILSLFQIYLQDITNQFKLLYLEALC